ncbi:DUF6338 family protein [Rhodoplanes azumiensis]|uniref:DUF6338 family protein n=1 Tax=Rhodoplanes azumiensis TaxID=1897628 RepID=A0ABW5AE18_9BRAD
MDIKDVNVWAVIAYLLPGVVMVQARSIAARASLSPLSKDNLALFVVVTVLYGVGAWAFGIAPQTPDSVAKLGSSAVLKYSVVAPIVLGFGFGLLERYGGVRWMLQPFGVNVPLPFKSVWVEVFSRLKEGSYVIVVLKDGTIYNALVTADSRFSSDPLNLDLYVGQTFSLDNWEPSEPRRGVYIRASEIRSIEVIEKR